MQEYPFLAMVGHETADPKAVYSLLSSTVNTEKPEQHLELL